MATIDFRQLAVTDALRAGIDPNVFTRQINQESGFQPGVTSGAGAQGIAQIVPRYHPDAPAASNPAGQLQWAANYMAGLIKQYGGWAPALSVYNSGQPDKYKDPNFASGQTFNYVKNILGGSTGATSTPPDRSLASGKVKGAVPASSTVTTTSANAAQQQSNFAPLLAALMSSTPTPVTMPTVHFQQPTMSTPTYDPSDPTANPFSQSFPTPTFTQPQLTAPVTPQAPQNDDALFSSILSSLGKPQALTASPSPKTAVASSPTGPVVVKTQGKPTSTTQNAVNLVKEYLGTPYVWGGEKPGGFDCSGLLQYVWAKEGVTIPRTTYDQFQTGTPVKANQLQPGDAVFFTGSDPKNGLPGHVGMYIGDGKMIEAPHTGATVRISNIAGRSDYVGARRYA